MRVIREGRVQHLLSCKHAFAELASPAVVVAGAVNWRRGMPMAQVLAAADSALAIAESRGAFAVQQAQQTETFATVLGEDEWRRRLVEAISDRRLELVRYPVVGRQKELVHHECPLRIQLDESGHFETAAKWLPMALRTGLISRIDEAAVELALTQIRSDLQPRGVNISPASLADSAFVPRLRSHLASSPDAARLLWLEVAETAAVDRFDMVRELCKQLRPLGAKIGLEHAGDRLGRIKLLFEAGLDYVKLAPGAMLDAGCGAGTSRDLLRAR